MATRKAKKLAVPPKPKKATLKEQLVNLQAAVRSHVVAIQTQSPESFQITMQSVTPEGKDGFFKVSSLLSSVLTAQGLGKQVRLEAIPGDKNGVLYVRMYKKVDTTYLSAALGDLY